MNCYRHTVVLFRANINDTLTVCCLCVQGLRKRELLREVLPVIGENLRFQRLFTEYQDQLELLRNK